MALFGLVNWITGTYTWKTDELKAEWSLTEKGIVRSETSNVRILGGVIFHLGYRRSLLSSTHWNYGHTALTSSFVSLLRRGLRGTVWYDSDSYCHTPIIDLKRRRLNE